MVRGPTVSISMRELDRPKCIQAVIDGDLKPGQAAERLVIRYRREGPVGLVSRHRNRHGNRGLKAPLVEHVVGILRAQYADFGPTLAAEKLKARHKIVLAKETVRQILIAAGLWLPRKLRPPKVTMLVYVAATGRVRSVGNTVGVLTFTGSIGALAFTASALSSPRRYSCLQANTWFGLTLCRRTTLTTEAPRACISWTMHSCAAGLPSRVALPLFSATTASASRMRRPSRQIKRSTLP